MVKQGPMKLVAAADVFPERIEHSLNYLNNRIEASWDRTDSEGLGRVHRRSARASLRRLRRLPEGDGLPAARATLPFSLRRWRSAGVHFGYAIEKGLNVFMEKPLTADGPTSRRMLEQAKASEAKNLKVGVGLMSRHSRALQQLHARIQDGEIGDLILMQAYRLIGPLVTAFSERWPGTPSELLWQLRRFHSFPLGQRRRLQRFLHPRGRSLLLDEERPAGQGAVGGRASLPQFAGRETLRRPGTSTSTRPSTRLPTGRN